MYCSLEDAWGDNNLTSSQNNILTTNNNLDPYNLPDLNNSYKSIDDKPQDTPAVNVEPIIENYENNNSIENYENNNSIENYENSNCMEKLNCSEIVDKILACPTCKSLLMKKLNNSDDGFANSIFENSFMKNNKEIIIVTTIIIILIIIIDFIIQVIKK
jgi:hypothetical protein